MPTDPQPAPWWPPRYTIFRLQMRWQFGKLILANMEGINQGDTRIGFEWHGWHWVMRLWDKEHHEVLDNRDSVVTVHRIEEIRGD